MNEKEPARPAPQKTVREYLQEIANANTVETARQGFSVIDGQTARLKRKLKGLGIAGVDEFVDSAATAVKRKAAELMTGRPQQ